MQSLTKLFAKQVGSQRSLFICSSFSVKMMHSSDKTFATAAFRLISLAAARLVIISCVSSSVVFDGSLQQFLPASVMSDPADLQSLAFYSCVLKKKRTLRCTEANADMSKALRRSTRWSTMPYYLTHVCQLGNRPLRMCVCVGGAFVCICLPVPAWLPMYVCPCMHLYEDSAVKGL